MAALLTHGEAALQNVNGSFLLQEVHETKEEILLLPDVLQLQLQNLLHDDTGVSIVFQNQTQLKPHILTDCFLLTSAYFCRNGTGADGGSVAASGWRHKRRIKFP